MRCENLLYDWEDFVTDPSNWLERGDDNNAKNSQRRNTIDFFVSSKKRYTIFKMVPNPQRSMEHGTKKHGSARPAMDKVKFLISIARSKN